MVYRVCQRCVMDNSSDDRVSFDDAGFCNYCSYAFARKDRVYYPNSKGQAKLERLLDDVKKESKGREFDCLMGLSGGLDSSYLAYLGATQWGLRVLGVHVDDGFNTTLADHNIKRLSDDLSIPLIIEQPDRVEYLDVVRAFLRAGLPGLAIPQDNVLQAYLYKALKHYKIKYFFSGANFATESILQRSHGHISADSTHLRDVHRIYGSRTLSKLKTISLFDRFIAQKYVRGIKMIRPLDFINYRKDEALAELQAHTGFQDYGGKHDESIFTKFLQSYWLPRKFSYDKRRSHLSSLIVSGQLTRENALSELAEPMYTTSELEKVAKSFLAYIEIDEREFEEIMKSSGRMHSQFRASPLVRLYSVGRMLRRFIE